MKLRLVGILLVSLLGAALTGCGYNDLQSQDEQVKAAWSEVTSGEPISCPTS
jgi:LemA protein